MTDNDSPKKSERPENDSPKKSGRFVDAALWIGAIVIVLLALRPGSSSHLVGKEAPRVSVQLLDTEGRLALPGQPGKPMLIEAFASWCGACRRTSSMLSGLGEKPGQLDFLMVSVDDSLGAAEGARRAWPITTQVAHDFSGQFSKRYEVRVLPTFILIDAAGKVVRVTEGIPGASDLRAFNEVLSR